MAGCSRGNLYDERAENGFMTIEAELYVPAASMQVVHYLFVEPVSGAMRRTRTID